MKSKTIKRTFLTGLASLALAFNTGCDKEKAEDKVNEAPYFKTEQLEENETGTKYFASIQCDDADEDAVTYIVNNLPVGFSYTKPAKYTINIESDEIITSPLEQQIKVQINDSLHSTEKNYLIKVIAAPASTTYEASPLEVTTDSAAMTISEPFTYQGSGLKDANSSYDCADEEETKPVHPLDDIIEYLNK